MGLISFCKGRTGRAVISVTAVMIVAAVYAGHAKEADDDSKSGRGPGTYTIGLVGDAPYNTLGKAQYPALLADINASHVAFSVLMATSSPAGMAPAPIAFTRQRSRISTG